ncbi:MAG: hypothetical protein BJ554DRAFT_1093, partial [Olpidium bornovanus]
DLPAFKKRYGRHGSPWQPREEEWLLNEEEFEHARGEAAGRPLQKKNGPRGPAQPTPETLKNCPWTKMTGAHDDDAAASRLYADAAEAVGNAHGPSRTPFFFAAGETDGNLEDEQETAETLERDLSSAAVNYYAVLNVGKTHGRVADALPVPSRVLHPRSWTSRACCRSAFQATEDEIKESYKRLCRTFHPDKHVDPDDKKAAERKFQIIQRAYEGAQGERPVDIWGASFFPAQAAVDIIVALQSSLTPQEEPRTTCTARRV